MTERYSEVTWGLYQNMLFCRLFENAVAKLWREGLISGEMHLGTGEEGIIAGVAAHLQPDDALALDHRPTAPMLLHGVDPAQMLHEILGNPEGLGKGQGGHMHLFSKEHLSASSGIVGASGPAGVGFALAGSLLRPGSVTVAYFGEGALNQGMLMESFNLAVEWSLPVVFVCKDDNWAITTLADSTPGVSPAVRAAGFGLPVYAVDGNDVEAVYLEAGKAIQHARDGSGPVFIHAACSHYEGHMVDLQIVRVGRSLIKEGIAIAGPVLRALFATRGAPLSERWGALRQLLRTIFRSAKDHRSQANDPLNNLRQKLVSDPERLQRIETESTRKVEAILAEVFPANGLEVYG
jgi:pyruvate dehydrogenase E1 component alpha subunit